METEPSDWFAKFKTSSSDELPHLQIVSDRLVVLGKSNFTKTQMLLKSRPLKLALMKKKKSWRCQTSNLNNAPIKWKLQHRPTPWKPRAFDYFLCPGSGEFDGSGLSRGGEFEPCLGWLWKIKPEVSSLEWFFFSGAEVANRELKQTRRRRKQERHLKM